MSAFHTKLAINESPCPGPGDKREHIPCPKASIIGPGKHALRCWDCRDARRRQAASKSQSRRNVRQFAGVKKRGSHKHTAFHGETPRTPVKRCKVCLGTPHLREPGREDDYGRAVCKPGTDQCRGCDGHYIPLPPVHAQSTLGSSSWTAAKAATW